MQKNSRRSKISNGTIERVIDNVFRYERTLSANWKEILYYNKSSIQLLKKSKALLQIFTLVSHSLFCMYILFIVN